MRNACLYGFTTDRLKLAHACIIQNDSFSPSAILLRNIHIYIYINEILKGTPNTRNTPVERHKMHTTCISSPWTDQRKIIFRLHLLDIIGFCIVFKI